MNTRDLKLSDYGISKAKYMELKYFCMQYKEKKEQLEDSYGLHSHSGEGPSGGISKPTEAQGVKNADIQHDVWMIEQTAIEADPEVYQYILKNVTEGMPYEYMEVPCGRRQFYESRRYFFYLLAQKR